MSSGKPCLTTVLTVCFLSCPSQFKGYEQPVRSVRRCHSSVPYPKLRGDDFQHQRQSCVVCYRRGNVARSVVSW